MGRDQAGFYSEFMLPDFLRQIQLQSCGLIMFTGNPLMFTPGLRFHQLDIPAASKQLRPFV
jgi:hypothetical protein